MNVPQLPPAHTSNFLYRLCLPTDRETITQFIQDRWGAAFVVGHGQVYYPADLPGWICLDRDKIAGLLTYQVYRKACEVVSIDSLFPGQGIGSSLINAVAQTARELGCRKLWLVTTNDNLDALRFYQRRGFRLRKVFPGAVEKSRQIKPEIPLLGKYGIPIWDEIELVFPLE